MAGTIDQLNFEVILKDADFRTQIDKDIELADKLNAHLSDALNFKKRIQTAPLKTYRAEMEKVEKASRRASTAQGEFNRRVDAVNSRLNSSSRLLRNISVLTGGAFSIIGLRRFLSTLIDITGQFEVQKMALRNMLQDVDGADKIFEDLYNFSSKSTYRFSELAKYAKQLAAFNISQDSLLETTKMLGDVASGVGVSMDRLILAYGHVKSSGFLRGIQLRSFSQNGVPILEELSKMLTEIEGKAVSLGDVFDKMTKREISFEMVEEAFKRMTSEGGKFYQMQEVLAKTLAGQINILKGKWENLMYAMGESQDGFLKNTVASLTRIVSSTEAFGRAMKEAIAVLGAYRIATLTTIAVTEGLATAINTSLVGRALNGLRAFLVANPYALLAASIAALTLAIYKASTEASRYTDTQKALNKATADWQKSVNTEIAELNSLYAKLQLAKSGTEEYASAKRDLENRFDPYIQKLKDEGVEVSNLSALYDGLKRKVEEAAYTRFVDNASKEIDEIHAGKMGTILRGNGRDPYTVAQMVRDLALDERETAALQKIVTGASTYEKILTSGMFPSLIDKLEKETNRINVGGDIGPIKPKEFLDMLIKKAAAATTEWEEGRAAITDYAKSLKLVDEVTNGSGKNDAAIVRISSIVDAIKAADRDIAALRKKASAGGITEEEEERLKKLVEAREEDAKRYKEIMGVEYDKQAKAATAADNKLTKERISNIKSEIAIWEKYRDAREKLEPLFGEETDRQLVKLFGPGDYKNIESEIQGLIADLKELGEEGVQAAEQIEARLGMDALGLLLKQQKSIEKYEKTLSDWMGEDFSHSGTGVEYKARRIAAKYNEDVTKTYRKFNKAVEEAQVAHKGNAAAIDIEIKKLSELRDAELEYHKAQRDEGISSLAKEVYEDATRGMNLTDWARKSAKELTNIQTKLRNIEVPAWVHQIFEHDREGFEKFIAALRALADADIDKASEVFDEKRLNDFRKGIEITSALADALRELGETNPAAADLGESLDFLASTASSALERLAKGDYIGAIIALVAGVVSQIVKGFAEAQKLSAALRNAREESRRAGFSNLLSEGADGVFGENALAKVRNAAAAISKLQSSMASRKTPDLFHTDGSSIYGKLNTRTLDQLAKSVGGALYDAYGNLNAETLQSILDNYSKLKTGEKEWIQAAINDSEAYAEAMEQLDDVMESLFGNIAGQAADKIVDAWAEAGDAALDYVDILDDVARSYAKMITQSMLIDAVFTPDFKDRLMGFFKAGDTENAMALILGGMEQLREMAPMIAEALEPLRPYIQPGGSGAETLKDGINKELVEGNSSLIASYMNAMRADLSVLRGLQTTGWQDIRFVRDSVPTFMDYAAQVAANTYDNAQATQAILSRLQSVITPSTSGGSAVRTTK